MLSPKLAQKIVEAISNCIGYDCIITDDQAVIIAATETKRIGMFNGGAMQVIESGRPLQNYPGYLEGMENTKPGYTVPLCFDDKIIGTLGITGVQEIVKNYSNLAQQHTLLLIQEQFEQQSRSQAELLKQNLLREIISFDPDREGDAMLLNRGKELGFYLNSPHAALLISLKKENINSPVTGNDEAILNMRVDLIVKEVFRWSRSIIISIGDKCFLVLRSIPNDSFKKPAQLNEELATLMERLCTLGFIILIGYGEVSAGIKGIKQSCKEAALACKVGQGLNQGSQIIRFKDVLLEASLLSIPDDIQKSLQQHNFNKILGMSYSEDLIKTVITWCESGFNRERAAKMLFVHRNTLNYRIIKIKEITGCDLTDPQTALFFYYCAKLYQLTGITHDSNDQVENLLFKLNKNN